MSYRILVVDDSPVSRKIVRRAVQMSGIDSGEILEAGNGKEALELLGKSWIDVVLADINMPVMDGLELVSEMAKQDYMKATPVVIISSEKGEQKVEQMLAMGVSAYVPKPFRPEQLKQIIGKLLREKKGEDHG